MSGKTREPGNGLPSKNKVSVMGGMLAVEFIFGDIGDRAVALTEIGELIFTPFSKERQPKDVMDEGDYLKDDEGEMFRNPALLGSIDVRMKRTSNDPNPERRDFYFSCRLVTWQLILDAMRTGNDYQNIS